MEHKLRLDEIKQLQMKISQDMAKKDDLHKFKSSLQSQVYGAEAHVQRVKMGLLDTDLYLDRYLPVKILNYIKEFVEDAYMSHFERKAFCEKLKKAYTVAQKKIG